MTDSGVESFKVDMPLRVESCVGGFKITINGREGFAAKYESVPARVKELLTPDFPKAKKS